MYLKKEIIYIWIKFKNENNLFDEITLSQMHILKLVHNFLP